MWAAPSTRAPGANGVEIPPDPSVKALRPRRPAAARRLQRAYQRATIEHSADRKIMTPTDRPISRGMLLGLGLTAVMMVAGCDQVRQRLTPTATGQNAAPPSPSPASSQSPSSPQPSAPAAPAAPATSTAPTAPVAPANPLTPMPPSSPAVAPISPVERYSSHQGSSGVGPVERRQSSSGARP